MLLLEVNDHIQGTFQQDCVWSPLSIYVGETLFHLMTEGTHPQLCLTISHQLNIQPGRPQVIKAVLKDADDKTELALLYANQTPDDILLFDELQELAADPRLRVHYTGARVSLGSIGCSNSMIRLSFERL